MIDVKYLAGLFDGEGHIGISQTNPTGSHISMIFALQASIANNHRGVLEQIQIEYGGGISSSRNCWTLQWTSKNAADFLRKIEPYLIIKKEQADLALEFDRLVRQSSSQRKIRLTNDEIEDRLWFSNEIRRVRV